MSQITAPIKFGVAMTASVVLGILGVVQIGSNPVAAIRDIIEMGLVMVAIVGTAYLMRNDVAELKRWRKDQDSRTIALERLTADLANYAKNNAIGMQDLKDDFKEYRRDHERHNRGQRGNT